MLLGDLFVVGVDIIGCVGLVESELREALLIVVPGVALVTGKKETKFGCKDLVVKVYN